ncbi:hypothetical protein Cni_G23541 [Canna indica]|uniref:Uncharacterized protein n=1 Tax=Canna indica TaxID=4628 RepID=A0AAQ3QNQ2_9LILI|nr:hypothetical protein Cni_G23541 [Canna indica]
MVVLESGFLDPMSSSLVPEFVRVATYKGFVLDNPIFDDAATATDTIPPSSTVNLPSTSTIPTYVGFFPASSCAKFFGGWVVRAAAVTTAPPSRSFERMADDLVVVFSVAPLDPPSLKPPRQRHKKVGRSTSNPHLSPLLITDGTVVNKHHRSDTTPELVPSTDLEASTRI